jgi:arylsulfatase A-like enzyme
LTGRGPISTLAPLWGILGIGLPLTFAGGVRSATMFMQPHELISLYATEWLILALLGTGLTVAATVLDIVAGRLHAEIENRFFSRVGFAMVVITSAVFASETWFNSFGRDTLSPGGRHCILLIAALVAVGSSTRRAYRESLKRLANLARSVALLGAFTLLSILTVRDASPAASAKPIEGVDRTSNRPNIVLISVDALAASHLIPYGSRRPTSPNIAAFAARAIVFEQFHANSNFTTPSVATMLTGVHPWKHRALQLPGRPNSESVADSLPARLHSAGYVTAYFGSNPWAGASRQGFSSFFDYGMSSLEWISAPCFDALTKHLAYLCSASLNPLIEFPFKLVASAAHAIGLVDLNKNSDLEQTVAIVDRWTQTPKNAPIFIWLHIFPPHDPYAAPEPWLGRFDSSPAAINSSNSRPEYFFESAHESTNRIRTLEARYDESVAYADHFIGKLITVVRANLGPNTAILLTADHGESFAHGYGGHSGVMLYEDLLRIPLIMSLSDASNDPQRRLELADQTDIAPTIAAIAEIKPSPRWDGISLIGPARDDDERTIFAMNFEQNASRGRLSTGSVGALHGHWKLVRFFGEPRYPHMPRLEAQLFDIASDPNEMRNVATAHPEIVTRLSAQIDEKLRLYGGAISDQQNRTFGY